MLSRSLAVESFLLLVALLLLFPFSVVLVVVIIFVAIVVVAVMVETGASDTLTACMPRPPLAKRRDNHTQTHIKINPTTIAIIIKRDILLSARHGNFPTRTKKTPSTSPLSPLHLSETNNYQLKMGPPFTPPHFTRPYSTTTSQTALFRLCFTTLFRHFFPFYYYSSHFTLLQLVTSAVFPLIPHKQKCYV